MVYGSNFWKRKIMGDAADDYINSDYEDEFEDEDEFDDEDYYDDEDDWEDDDDWDEQSSTI